MADHFFEAHPDLKRSRRSCRHCGRVPDVHPDPPVRHHPDPDLDGALTQAACSGKVDPAALNQLADERAHDSELRAFLTRDFDQDGIEEAADWRNYLVWGMRQAQMLEAAGRLDATSAQAKQQLRARALAHVAIAFELTRAAAQS